MLVNRIKIFQERFNVILVYNNREVRRNDKAIKLAQLPKSKLWYLDRGKRLLSEVVKDDIFEMHLY